MAISTILGVISEGELKVTVAIISLATALTVAIPQLLKTLFDNKKRSKKEEIRDKWMSDQLTSVVNDQKEIKEKVSELAEMHKHYRFSKDINANVNTIISNIIESRSLENEELKQIFFTSADQFKSVINSILDSDFQEIDSKKVISILKIKAKSVRSQINLEKLQLEQPFHFLDITKNRVIVPSFAEFSVKLYEIAESKQNGVRREAFKRLVLDMVAKIVSETITIYSDSQKK